MKVLSTIIVLVTVGLFNVTASDLLSYNGGNINWGIRARSGRDRVMYSTRVIHRGNNIRLAGQGVSSDYVRYGFIGKVTVDVDLPMNNRGFDGTITYIEGVNQARSEGIAKITRGGIGYNYVSVHFEGDYSRDIDFLFNIYGCFSGYC
ncbi:uncharacterized protein [Halyomorpha halys]|uniref:uncharacterized protein n=1 Tax=Halyomorpha halys TaxID=286706 RepID=UPI0006D51A7D|nr:uncharacterized protein LOC106678299 [Halyomorpha halys]